MNLSVSRRGIAPLREAYEEAQRARNTVRSALFDAVLGEAYSSGEDGDSDYWVKEFGDNKARIESNINEVMLEAAEFARDVVPYLSLSRDRPIAPIARTVRG